jgi:nucleoid-associated protein YgaU
MITRALGYQMWLSHNSGFSRIRVPVLPEVFNVTIGTNNSSVSVQGLGEMVIIQDPVAKVLQFNSFFPSAPIPGARSLFPLVPPLVLANRIDAWKESPQPVHFLLTGTWVNGHYAIQNFNWFERGGDVGTIHYTITLKEYHSTSVRRVDLDRESGVATIPSATMTRVDNRVMPETHTVERGDNLWNIAQRYLGDGSRYPEIAALNPVIRNPSLIHPGQILRLPV